MVGGHLQKMMQEAAHECHDRVNLYFPRSQSFGDDYKIIWLRK
jgi:hypothetical protein